MKRMHLIYGNIDCELILKIQEEEHITYQKFSIGRKEKGRKEVKITERSKNHKRKEKQYFN